MKVKLNTEDTTLATHFILYMPDEEADALLTEFIRDEMRIKLAKKRQQGRGGWFTTRINNETLKQMLKEHTKKGDMIDVINIAAMIMARERLWGETA